MTARQDAPRPEEMRGVFVVGIARSGTSLLKALLDGHPELWVPPAESAAVKWCGAPDPTAAFLLHTQYARLFPEGTEDHARLVAALRTALPGPADPATAVRAFLSAMATVVPPATSARVWVEKTPRHLRIVPLMLARFGPSARAIGLVRDPRATLASQVRRWKRGCTPEDVAAFARRWASADELTRLYERRFPAFLAVRYEDLVRDPRPVMEAVAAHLGIAFREELVTPTRGGRVWGGNSSDGRSQPGVSTRSLERYAEDLPPELLASLEQLLAPRMRGRGYETGSEAALRPSWRRLLHGLAVRRVVAAQRSAWEREGRPSGLPPGAAAR